MFIAQNLGTIIPYNLLKNDAIEVEMHFKTLRKKSMRRINYGVNEKLCIRNWEQAYVL